MRRIALFVSFCLVAAGCSRAKIETVVSPDGSFKRTVTYTLSGAQGMMGNGKKDIADVFKIPSAGDGVTVDRSTTKDGDINVTVTRSLAAGAAPVDDFVIFQDAKQPELSDTLSVHKLDNGQIEYTESLKWIAKRGGSFGEVPPEFRTAVKASLPQRMMDTATIDMVTNAVMVSFLRALFGPPEPVFPSFFTDPDLGVRKLKIASYQALIPTLQQACGMSAAETKAFLGSFLSDERLKSVVEGKTPTHSGGQTGTPDNAAMVPMTFSVSAPGKVVRTNGLVDPINGQVYWSVYDVSAEFQDVTLELVVDPKS